MEKLSAQQISEKLQGLNDNWKQEDEFIKRSFSFRDFKQAFAFMTNVAFMAEKADHHPNWDNTYKNVNIALSTHEAGGLTEKDFDLAAKIDEVAGHFG